MPMTKSRRATLLTLLRKRSYRRVYVESFFNTRLAAQIKLLREARGLSQQRLAATLGTQQSAVSKLETGGYSGWSVKTLRRMARAFDLALQVQFISFGEAFADIEGFSKSTLLKPSFADDPVFQSLSGHVPYLTVEGRVTGQLLTPASTRVIGLSNSGYSNAVMSLPVVLSTPLAVGGDDTGAQALLETANDNLAKAS